MLKPIFISLALLCSVFAGAITKEAELLIKTAVTSADFSKMNPLFAESCNLILLGKSNKGAKDQTIKSLNDFFKTRPANGYKIIHKGANDNNSFIIVGFTSGQNNYRIHILANNKNNQDIINQIRIENNNE